MTVSYYDSTGSRGYELSKPYSEKTAELIDEEVKALINRIHDRTYRILTENKDKFLELAALLLEKEVIFADDMERIFGPRANASGAGMAEEKVSAEAEEKAEESES